VHPAAAKANRIVSTVTYVMLALINKGERADLSQAERNELRKELAGYAEDYRANVRRRVQAMNRN
jgi:hypothetical protein